MLSVLLFSYFLLSSTWGFLYGQIMINYLFPDPIPVVDEVLMIASVINGIIRLNKMIKIGEWVRLHKVLSLLFVIG